MSDRKDIELIAELVPHGLARARPRLRQRRAARLLSRERGCSGYGIEIDDANVLACHAARRQRHPAQPRGRPGAVRGPELRRRAAARHAAAPAATPRRCCARRRASAASASSASRTSRTGRTACTSPRGRMPVTRVAALPVVRHAEHPRRHLRRLRGAGAQGRPGDPRRFGIQDGQGGAPLAQPARQRRRVQVRARPA